MAGKSCRPRQNERVGTKIQTGGCTCTDTPPEEREPHAPREKLRRRTSAGTATRNHPKLFHQKTGGGEGGVVAKLKARSLRNAGLNKPWWGAEICVEKGVKESKLFKGRLLPALRSKQAK